MLLMVHESLVDGFLYRGKPDLIPFQLLTVEDILQSICQEIFLDMSQTLSDLYHILSAYLFIAFRQLSRFRELQMLGIPVIDLFEIICLNIDP